MLFYLMRIMIVAIIILILYFVFFIKSVRFYKYALICMIPGILLINVLSYVPFEKAFNLFASPEKAFSYSSIDRAEFVIEGENTALVYYSERLDNSAHGFKFFQKQKDKWYIVYNHSSFYEYDIEVVSPYVMYVFDVKETSERFIIIENLYVNEEESNIDISDTLQSNFEQYISKYKYLDDVNIYYYTVLKEMPENYEIMIDGKVVYPLKES